MVRTANGWFYVHAPGLDEPLLLVKRNINTWAIEADGLLQALTDGRGQLIAIADTLGEITSAYAGSGYDQSTWKGAGLTSRAQTFSPKKWQTGSDWGGVQQFRNRAYDPATGRWLQEDPIGVSGGVNLYQYNGSNPASFADPFGLCPPRDDSPCTLGDIITLNVSAGLQAGATITSGIVGVYAHAQVGPVASIAVSAKYPAELTSSGRAPVLEFGGEVLNHRGGLQLDMAGSPQVIGSSRLGGNDVGREHVQRGRNSSVTRIGVAVGLGFDVNINWTAAWEVVTGAARNMRRVIEGGSP